MAEVHKPFVVYFCRYHIGIASAHRSTTSS